MSAVRNPSLNRSWTGSRRANASAAGRKSQDSAASTEQTFVTAIMSGLGRYAGIEKNLPIFVVPHQALDPEDRSEAPTRCRLDAG